MEEEQIFPSENVTSLVLKDDACQDESERFFKRFIDDMIAAIEGNEEFVDWLNAKEPGLKFTYEWSDQEITFLDTKMWVQDGRLETDRFIKPNNPQMFLHYTSNGPRSVFKAIVYGH